MDESNVSWSRCFPFPGGTVISVEGPFGYGGTGRVVRRTSDVLAFELRLPAKRILLKKLPELELALSLTATREGGGNRARGTWRRGGGGAESFEDDDVTIRTDAKTGVRDIRSSIVVGGKPLAISIASKGPDEARLRIAGHDFVLRRAS
jgi:hypothetical protein